MNIKTLKRKVKHFEENTKFNKTKFRELIKMFEEEVKILKKSETKKEIVDHELTDLLILIMQIANRYNTDFDKEIKKWSERSKKYLK